MTDPEITPSDPDSAHDVDAQGNRDRPRADDIPLPEEISEGDETVEADTASGGAPEPAGDDDA